MLRLLLEVKKQLDWCRDLMTVLVKAACEAEREENGKAD